MLFDFIVVHQIGENSITFLGQMFDAPIEFRWIANGEPRRFVSVVDLQSVFVLTKTDLFRHVEILEH